MTFRFLHTGDWHIGKPFGRFPEERQSILRRARLDAVDRLAAEAERGNASVVLVAGDVFDSPGLADHELLTLAARLGGHRRLHWYVIPGNHDPATPSGIWDRFARLATPPNIHVCRDAAPVAIAPDVVLLPSPLNAKALSSDPTAWMTDAPSPPDAIRIGLAHGSTQGFGSQGTSSVAISPARARDAGLAYLALGDWHGCREVAQATWYAGTPEPDSYQDNDPGHALLISIDGPSAPAKVERRRVAEFTWIARRLRVDRATDLDPLLRDLDGLAHASRSLLDLSLEGEVALAEDDAIRARLEREIAPRLFHLDQRLERLRLVPPADDLETLADPALRRIAEDLVALSRTAAPDASVAALALRRLYGFTRAADGDA